MRVPPLFAFGAGYCNKKAKLNPNRGYLKPQGFDTVAFSSIASYLRRYVTLPDEIKEQLPPKEGVDMLKYIDLVAARNGKYKNIGQGNYSKLYKNPWLKDYDLLILSDTNYDTQIIYSNERLGNSVWKDVNDSRIQLVKRAA